MTNRHRIAACLGLGIVLLAGTATRSAVAQEEAADPALQEAKAAFEEAQALFTKDQFADAAAKFLLAYDKKPFSSFLFNAAVAFEKAKEFQKAADIFQRYLAVDPQARDAAEVKTRIDTLKAALAPAVRWLPIKWLNIWICKNGAS